MGTQPSGSGFGNVPPLQNFVAAGVPSMAGSVPGSSGAYHAVRYCRATGLLGSLNSVCSLSAPKAPPASLRE